MDPDPGGPKHVDPELWEEVILIKTIPERP
jgi:hypothetical protein